MVKKSVGFGIFVSTLMISAAAQTTVTTSATTTAGSVPVFGPSSTSTVTNSPISISGSSVGIGTTSPATKLDVTGGAVRADNGFELNTQTFTDGSKPVNHYGLSWVDFSNNTTGPSALLSGFGGVYLYSGGNRHFTMDVNGNVGVGTTSPQQQFHVASTNLNGIQWATVLQNPNDSGNANTGVGIQFKTSDYSTNAEQTKWAGITAAGDIGQGWNDYLGLAFYTHNGSGTAPSEVVRINSTGNMGIGTTNPQAKLEINGNLRFTADGSVQTTAWTGVLCGGDYAESMDVTGNRANYEPGDLLVLDTDHPGEVLKSIEPYSTAVSGIYATKPGAIGRRQVTPANDSEVPMAMIGVVPTKVSAENGSIHVGDLLVSSSTPGHAMKGTDRSRLVGAVIGKAMGTLDSGSGVIEVLVTLQ